MPLQNRPLSLSINTVSLNEHPNAKNPIDLLILLNNLGLLKSCETNIPENPVEKPYYLVNKIST